MSTVLQTNNLTKTFGGVIAVDGANIKIKKNQINAIIGPNGAGKTTFFNVITGLYKATSGSVILENRDITNMPEYKIVEMGICRTFQINSLFSGATIHENIRIACQIKNGGTFRIMRNRNSLHSVNRKTLKVLEKVGLQDKAESYANEISYGEQRALEVGIALACEPKILLLDEPTAGMSEGETKNITKMIENLSDEITIVLVEHDVEMVMSISNNMTVMDRGKIIAEGSPDTIRNDRLVKKAYLGEG